jgi:hypothetical protein
MTRLPGSPDLSHDRWVDDEVPEGPDRGHVGGSEPTIGLRVDGHLAVVATSPVGVGDPPEVHDPVHGPVGDLRGELVVDQVERGEGEPVEVRAGWGVAQIDR